MRRIPAAAAVLLLASLAFATPLGGAVATLEAAGDARVAAILTPTKEQKQLAKASIALDAYTGTALVTDAKALAAAAKALNASQTQDPGVVAGVADVLNCLTKFAQQELATATGTVVSIADPVIRGKALTFIGSAKTLTQTAQALAPTNVPGALIAITAAIGKIGKAVAAANGAATLPPPPANISYFSHSGGTLTITNNTGAGFAMDTIILDVLATFSDGSTKHIVIDAQKLFFKTHSSPSSDFVTPGSTYDCGGLAMRTLLLQQATAKGLLLSNWRGSAIVSIQGMTPFVIPSNYL